MAEEGNPQEMVLQLPSWRQKISSKLMAMNHYTPDMFVKSQWQTCHGVSARYLVYRWVHAAVFVSILIASVLGLGRRWRNDWAYHAKWLIYLTHWGFLVCTIQAVWAACIVTKARPKPSDEIQSMKMNLKLRIYWILHTIATVSAFAISVIYWTSVYNPAIYHIDAVNLLVHVGNSVLMMIDLLVIAHPVRLIDIYWPAGFAICYSIFNFFFYLAGGTDRKGRPYIYKILNWQNPEKTMIVVLFSLGFVLFLHFIVGLISLLRRKIAHSLKRKEEERREQRGKNIQGASNDIPINDLV